MAKSIKQIKLHVTRTKIAEGEAVYGQRVHNSRNVHEIAGAILRGADQEVFLCFHLDQRNKVLGYTEVARGSVNAAQAHPREAFRAAIVQGATSVIYAHNHPSGDATPSDADRALTKRLKDCGKLLGITVLDHVVVGDPGYFSFGRDAGIL